ncbi:MAG: thiamine pyrophosphate-binding protein [Acidimicrobiia bacterium]|nr:thiamine pyrophosphate-binding protein [Acidimicrobiia bacterium]
MSWEDACIGALRAAEVDLVTYVPDRVLGPLIARLEGDDAFTVLSAAREEEALGIVAGAYLGGRRGIVLMQTSGFATLANVLASLAVPFRIPIPMLVSERGTLGEFQLGQAMVCRTMRPILDAIGIEHHTIERLDDVGFVIGRMLDQAYSTQESAAMILSPLLTAAERAGPR